MEKYYKIGEISKLYNIGVDSLRYYEEQGIISPYRAPSGYRLYSINDIWRLNVIRELREIGFSMGQIKKYLDSHTVETTLELLEDEERAIEKKLERLNKLKENVKERAENLKSALNRPLEKIEIKKLPKRYCFSISEGYSDEYEMDILIKKLINLDKEHLFIIGNNQIGTKIDLEIAKKEGKLNYQSVFVADENGTDEIESGDYLTVSYKGEYKRSSENIKKLLDHAKAHNLKPIGSILEILWIDIHTTSDVSERVTELQIRVERGRK